jgi:hypothetical protein
VAVVLWGMAMTEAADLAAETDRLSAQLNAMEVHPYILQNGLGVYSEDSKNALVARLATGSSWPAPRLLARLPYILTPENRADMVAVYRKNLQSPDPQGRMESLYGLDRLGEPVAATAARDALRDNADDVVLAAVNILYPRAQQDPQLWRQLQDTYRARKDTRGLERSMGYLRDLGIEKAAPGTR